MDSINIRPQEEYSILLGTNVLYHKPYPMMLRRERFSVKLGVFFFIQLFCDFRQWFCKECLDLCFCQGVVEPPQIRDVAVEGIPMVRRLSND